MCRGHRARTAANVPPLLRFGLNAARPARTLGALTQATDLADDARMADDARLAHVAHLTDVTHLTDECRCARAGGGTTTCSELLHHIFELCHACFDALWRPASSCRSTGVRFRHRKFSTGSRWYEHSAPHRVCGAPCMTGRRGRISRVACGTCARRRAVVRPLTNDPCRDRAILRRRRVDHSFRGAAGDMAGVDGGGASVVRPVLPTPQRIGAPARRVRWCGHDAVHASAITADAASCGCSPALRTPELPETGSRTGAGWVRDGVVRPAVAHRTSSCPTGARIGVGVPRATRATPPSDRTATAAVAAARRTPRWPSGRRAAPRRARGPGVRRARSRPRRCRPPARRSRVRVPHRAHRTGRVRRS